MEIVYCDGSVSPLGTAISVVKRGVKISKVINQKLNIVQAERLALLTALELSSPGSIIYSDSRIIVNSIYFDEVLDKLVNQKKIQVRWIPRWKNRAGFVLEKRLDRIKREINNVVFPKLPKIKNKKRFIRRW